MTYSAHSKILWRKAGRTVEGGDESPLTSSRALRLALTRAANDTVGLVLTVMGISEEMQPLDDLLAGLGDDLMLIGLQREGQLAGLIALDLELRTAVMEMQTVGSLIGAAADPRPATGTDKTMCDPLVDTLLKALPKAMTGTEWDGWINGCDTGNRVTSTRAAGLILADCNYRILRLSVDLGVADRQGALVIALPPVAQATDDIAATVDDLDWSSRFRTIAANSPASLSAHLHRFSVPLAQAQALSVGQVLDLPGCDVHSVLLLDPDGKLVAQAKLGQIAGMRAVRIETAPPSQLSDLVAPDAAMPAAVARTDANDIPTLGIGDVQDVTGGDSDAPQIDMPEGMETSMNDMDTEGLSVTD